MLEDEYETWWQFPCRRYVELPPGEYFVGDTCYVLDDDFYHNGWLREWRQGKITYKGASWVVYLTRYGDGEFVDEMSAGTFSVDAASLGIVPRALCTKPDIEQRMQQLGSLVKFTSTVRVGIHNGACDNAMCRDYDCQCRSDSTSTARLQAAPRS